MSPSVLRVPRTDDPSGESPFVLINVESTSDSKPLNLKLVATDGEAPFLLILKQTQVHSLRAKNAQCDDREWEKILEALLKQDQNESFGKDISSDIEMVASVQEGHSITMTIRKHVQGITSRLGNLILRHDEDQEISLFHWNGLACESANSSRAQVLALQMRCTQQDAKLAALQAQLEQLTLASHAQETDLLQKFQVLLNEKKAKIRDQQRLLASANIDPQALERITAERKRIAAASRRSKRKAPQDDDDDESDGFEAMEVDGKSQDIHKSSMKDDKPANTAEEDADEGMQTPSESEDETADEDNEPVPAVKAKPKPLARNTRSMDAKQATSKAKAAEKEENPAEREVTPPRRELPFQQRKGKVKEKTPAPELADGDATASEDDDEL